jgi:hypothetical protein
MVLAPQRAGADSGLPLADQQRGVIAVPGGGQLDLVNVAEGARLVPDHRVRVTGRFQRPPLPPRPPRPATGLVPQRPRRRLWPAPPTTAAWKSSASSGPAGRSAPRPPPTAPPPEPAAHPAALDATSAAPRSQCPWPRSPRAAGHWPHAKRPPHPGPDRHRAQAIDDHQRQNVINTPRRARPAKITHRPLRLTLPQYLSSYFRVIPVMSMTRSVMVSVKTRF